MEQIEQIDTTDIKNATLNKFIVYKSNLIYLLSVIDSSVDLKSIELNTPFIKLYAITSTNTGLILGYYIKLPEKSQIGSKYYFCSGTISKGVRYLTSFNDLDIFACDTGLIGTLPDTNYKFKKQLENYIIQ